MMKNNEIEKDDRIKVLYDGEVIGRILTNHSMTINEALDLIGVDPDEWDWELFSLEY